MVGLVITADPLKEETPSASVLTRPVIERTPATAMVDEDTVAPTIPIADCVPPSVSVFTFLHESTVTQTQNLTVRLMVVYISGMRLCST